MELHEYPRPANDTGIGVHWTVGFASAIGIGRIRDFWIPELKSMGVKWVKVFNHDGAIDFCELLLSEGFMPIVRLFRPNPNPSTLDIREIVHLDAFIRAGIRYFEFNSEPDQDSEWKGGRLPANGIDLVVENTIANLETILERGGMPAVPAVSNGSRWDLVGRIVARGRKDLLNGPVWHAIHNYSRNRPLDYPYDIGNQEGGAYTQRFYQAIADERWGEDAWRGRTLVDVNRLRQERANPGATIMDDNACWLAYEYFDARNRRNLGHSIPILSTECGYIVGEDGDPRYPATTVDLHLAQTLEACRTMMGTSTRFQNAPDYYFCTSFWLLGNAALGNSSTWCEHHAWYSDRWPGGTLPVVRALKVEPKAVRRWQDNVQVGARATLQGTVSHAGDRRTVLLEKNGVEVNRTTLDANSRYVMPNLTPGNYVVRVEGSAVEQSVSLQPGQEEAVVNLDLEEAVHAAGGSVVTGRVRGGAGAVVMLLRVSDGEEWVTMARDDGSFRFVDLPPGTYTVRAQSSGSPQMSPQRSPRAEGIMLDGRNQRDVELAVAGWGHTIRRVNIADGAAMIRCSVEGHKDLLVQAHTGEWSSEPVATGSAPEVGEFACEIGPVDAGHYIVSVTGLTDDEGKPFHLEAYVNAEKRHASFVEFTYQEPVDQPEGVVASSIRGHVIGGCESGHRLIVRLIDDQAQQREQPVGPDCTFVFDGLAAGLYSVEVVGPTESVIKPDIALDGQNSVEVELMMPIAQAPTPARSGYGRSVIAAFVPDGARGVARLVDSAGNEQRQIVDAEGYVRFEGLAAGLYTLRVEGGYEQPDLTVNGASGLEVIFSPLSSTWDVKVSPAGSMPGYSVVRVEVDGMRDLPVYIWKEDWEGMMRRTGTKPEYGEFAAEFSPLGPGHYMIEPDGLEIWADVELTGLEVVWIDFRRRAAPSSPNVVRSLNSSGEAPRSSEGTGDGSYTEPYADGYGDGYNDDVGGFDEDEADWPTGDDGRADASESEDVLYPKPQTNASQVRHYLLLIAPVTDVEELAALLRYTARMQPVVGSDVEEALKALHVTIVGDSAGDSVGDGAGDGAGNGEEIEAIEDRLRAAHVSHERFSQGHAESFAADSRYDVQ